MKIKRPANTKGFTIIEVVLVLAIAGLIFMMVFIALPALQRSQRDTQRKNDLSRAITAITSYASNNRGSLPLNTAVAWGAFKTNYLIANGDSFVDPSGTDYIFTGTGAGGAAMAANVAFSADEPNIYVTTGASCDGDTIKTGQGARKLALQMKLEGGGIACQNN